MDIAAIATAFGVIVSGLAGFSGLIIALMERRRKQVDIAEKMTQIAFSLLSPLRGEVADLQKKVQEQSREIISLQQTVNAQRRTIEGMQQMLAEKDVMVLERDKVIVHMQGEIDLLTAKIMRLERRTGELHK